MEKLWRNLAHVTTQQNIQEVYIDGKTIMYVAVYYMATRVKKPAHFRNLHKFIRIASMITSESMKAMSQSEIAKENRIQTLVRVFNKCFWKELVSSLPLHPRECQEEGLQLVFKLWRDSVCDPREERSILFFPLSLDCWTGKNTLPESDSKELWMRLVGVMYPKGHWMELNECYKKKLLLEAVCDHPTWSHETVQEAFVFLLKKGCEINSTSPYVLLTHAVQRRDDKLFAFLVNHGIDLTTKNRQKRDILPLMVSESKTKRWIPTWIHRISLMRKYTKKWFLRIHQRKQLSSLAYLSENPNFGHGFFSGITSTYGSGSETWQAMAGRSIETIGLMKNHYKLLKKLKEFSLATL
jgi:hypothetical protein